MFTTGSKLFIGATVVSLVSTIVVGATTGGAIGMSATIGLITATVVFALVAGLNVANRDGNVTVDTPAESTGAADRGPGQSMWPMIMAVGLAGLVVGAVSKPVVFKAAVVVILAAGLEWLVQSYTSRATADAAYNKKLHQRLLHPLEFPVLGTVVIAAVVYPLSRLFLAAPKEGSLIAAIVVSVLIFVTITLIARRPGLGKGTVAGIGAVSLLALVGIGVASAVGGQRHIEVHPEITAAVCLGEASEAELEEIDHLASQQVSLGSAVAATVKITSDDRLVAFINGAPAVEYHELTVARASNVNVLFRNESSEPRRLTARLGTFAAADGTAGSENADCTTAVDPGKELIFTFRVSKPALASSTPYSLFAPGLEGQEIKLLVP
ncbi:MAG: hypothetical protein RJB65_200 [Actinomycetota bacterium]|jgi:hypothetical protein